MGPGGPNPKPRIRFPPTKKPGVDLCDYDQSYDDDEEDDNGNDDDGGIVMITIMIIKIIMIIIIIIFMIITIIVIMIIIMIRYVNTNEDVGDFRVQLSNRSGTLLVKDIGYANR